MGLLDPAHWKEDNLHLDPNVNLGLTFTGLCILWLGFFLLGPETLNYHIISHYYIVVGPNFHWASSYLIVCVWGWSLGLVGCRTRLVTGVLETCIPAQWLVVLIGPIIVFTFNWAVIQSRWDQRWTIILTNPTIIQSRPTFQTADRDWTWRRRYNTLCRGRQNAGPVASGWTSYEFDSGPEKLQYVQTWKDDIRWTCQTPLMG